MVHAQAATSSALLPGAPYCSHSKPSHKGTPRTDQQDKQQPFFTRKRPLVTHDACKMQYRIIRNINSNQIWLKGTKIERSSLGRSTLFLLPCTQASSSSTYECQHEVCNQKLCIYMGIKSNYDCIRCPFEKLLCKRESANSTE